jgi:alpha-tubulin suppressor-like RCC1 family protein
MAANGTAHMAIVTEDGQLWTWGWCALPPARPPARPPLTNTKV